MLPGNTTALLGGAAPIFGNDQFTTSLLHFKESSGWNLSTATIVDDGAAPGGGYGWAAIGDVYIQGGPAYPAWFHRALVIDQRLIGNSYAGLQGGTAAQARVWSAGDFTVDFWVYPMSSAGGCPVAKAGTSSYAPYLFLQNAGNWYFYSSSNNTSWDIANALAIGAATLNQWQHLAVQRKGNTWTFYLNGTQTGTWASSATPYRDDSAQLILGLQNGASLANQWTGMIDEFRFSQCARYSGNFSPPREPYYGVLNGGNDEATTLLLHFEGANNSTTITDDARGGLGGVRIPQPAGIANAVISTGNSKFGASCFSPSGNTGRIAYYNCTDFDFYVQNWTIDFWYYRYNSYGGDLFAKRQMGGAYAPFALLDNNGTLQLYMSSVGSSWDYANGLSCGTIPSNAWTHIAVVMRNQVVYVYMNGVLQNSASISGALWANADYFTIGATADASGIVPGLFDEFRISDVARWSGNFVPPTVPYGPALGAAPSWAAESFMGVSTALLHFEGSNGSTTITDSAYAPHSFTSQNSAQLTTSFAKFGGSSLVLNGAPSNMWVSSPSQNDWEFGNGNFTIDWWEYRTATAANACIVCRGDAGYQGFLAGYDTGSGTAQFYASSNGSSWDIANAASMGPIALNAWHHRAVQRNGNAFSTFYDGVQQQAWNASGTMMTSSNPLSIGKFSTGYYNGYIDELRVCKGQANYKGNFTPPSAPYTR